MVPDDSTRLAVELGFYASQKHEWLARQPWRYVVIKNKDVLGFYASFQEAYTAGARRYGLDEDFLVKQIVEREPVFFVF